MNDETTPDSPASTVVTVLPAPLTEAPTADDPGQTGEVPVTAGPVPPPYLTPGWDDAKKAHLKEGDGHRWWRKTPWGREMPLEAFQSYNDSYLGYLTRQQLQRNFYRDRTTFRVAMLIVLIAPFLFTFGGYQLGRRYVAQDPSTIGYLYTSGGVAIYIELFPKGAHGVQGTWFQTDSTGAAGQDEYAITGTVLDGVTLQIQYTDNQQVTHQYVFELQSPWPGDGLADGSGILDSDSGPITFQPATYADWFSARCSISGCNTTP